MGLDTYAQLDREIANDLDWPEESGGLCGGLFSGNGAGPSFRGKVYNDFVFSTTGISLYQEVIENSQVYCIADGIQEWLRKRIGTKEFESAETKVALKLNPDEILEEWNITLKEIIALYYWFRFAADQGCTVHGWW